MQAVQPMLTFEELMRLFQEPQLSVEEFSESKKKQTENEIKAINELSNPLAEFIADSLRPEAVGLFQKQGIDIYEIYQNTVVKRDGLTLEIDLIFANDESIIVVTCRSNLSIDDVNEYLERLAKIKRLIPRYKDKRITGAVAGMVIPEQVALYAMRKGLFVIAQNGGHLELANDAKFTAKIW